MAGFDEWIRIRPGRYISGNGLMKIEKTDAGWNIYEKTVGRGFIRIYTGCRTFRYAKAIAKSL